MESLVIPVIILAVVAAGVALAARAVSRRQAAVKQAGTAPAPDPVEVARRAAAKLSEDQHRRLYALIAQGQAMAAIKLYYEATGEGLRASRDAVGPWPPTRRPTAALPLKRRRQSPTTTTRPSGSPTATVPLPARAM
ncbi:hypothetical protein AHiyo4_50930 [Arthrobacter sp. Hiyo4]|nr:hypothetical protein AHiyo4_50930 [Arthrobacter sp. Hiyo4]